MVIYIKKVFTVWKLSGFLTANKSCEHVLVFPWDQKGLLLLGVPYLLVGGVYHVKMKVV